MTEITRETIIADILDEHPEVAPFFVKMGMQCLGCPSARGETVVQACAVHGVDPDKLIADINSVIK